MMILFTFFLRASIYEFSDIFLQLRCPNFLHNSCTTTQLLILTYRNTKKFEDSARTIRKISPGVFPGCSILIPKYYSRRPSYHATLFSFAGCSYRGRAPLLEGRSSSVPNVLSMRTHGREIPGAQPRLSDSQQRVPSRRPADTPQINRSIVHGSICTTDLPEMTLPLPDTAYHAAFLQK